MKTACTCVIINNITVNIIVVATISGECYWRGSAPFCKLVTVTEYSLDCRRLDIVVLVGTFEPARERDPVCDPLPLISDHCTLYPVAPSTSSQDTVAVVHVI